MADQVSGYPRRLPDPAICRTREIVSPRLMRCLVENPEACPFLTRYGGGFFCRHPDRLTFEVTAKPGV
jgi:hypothetical protein